jgi:hypothetical protein
MQENKLPPQTASTSGATPRLNFGGRSNSYQRARPQTTLGSRNSIHGVKGVARVGSSLEKSTLAGGSPSSTQKNTNSVIHNDRTSKA